MENNIKISFLIALFLTVVSFFVKQSVFIQMIISMQIFLFLVNTGTSLHADEVSKWNKFECTLPVKCRDVITAKYISFAALCLFGVFMGSVTALIDRAAGKLANFQSVLYGYEFGFMLSTVTVGIMFPLMLKIGTEKNELIVLLAAFASIGLLLLIAAVLTPLTGEMNIKHPLTGMTSAAAGLLIFVSSYFVSVKLYQSKEFA